MAGQIDERTLIKAAMSDAEQAKASFKAAEIFLEKYVSITRTGLLTADARPQTALFAITEAKPGDLINVYRAAKPTLGPPSAMLQLTNGVTIESTGYVPSAGVVEIYYTIPTIIVALGATLMIPLRLRCFRAP